MGPRGTGRIKSIEAVPKSNEKRFNRKIYQKGGNKETTRGGRRAEESNKARKRARTETRAKSQRINQESRENKREVLRELKMSEKRRKGAWRVE